ncbi:hypothetical protein [Halomarina rubra]|uniref:Polysaccharide deacetylase n=1 Tax=Halomarina rubra TaxID=2071873 RepID=A0ABD6B416_9EURY|nr:hypothetical protein [Halomarina rubra]
MRGTLTISIEVELGWGVHDLPDKAHLSADGLAERTYLQKLLSKTEQCDVPISFDIVGHLLLDECTGTHAGPYSEGWFDADPGTNAESDPLFYAPEMAEWILESSADHELCTHTFSHLLCRQASDATLDTELEAVQKLHRELDAPVVSFVPPRHSRPNNDVLRRNGIRIARYAKTKDSPTPAHRVWELAVGPHPEWEPQVVDDIFETYCTTYPSLTARTLPAGQRDGAHPVFDHLPLRARKRLHLYYLKESTRRAIESGTPLHLWCHLFDLSNEHQWEVLAEYLEYLAAIPAEDLEIRTMRQLAETKLQVAQ